MCCEGAWYVATGFLRAQTVCLSGRDLFYRPIATQIAPLYLSSAGATLAAEPNVDMLSTTPDKMLATVDNVLRLWRRAAKGAHIGDSDPSSMESQSAKLMKPRLIEEVQRIAAIIRRKFV